MPIIIRPTHTHMLLRRCIQCGSEFEPSRKINTLCSRKCLLARRSGQTNDGPRSVERACEQCGNVFVTGNSTKMTCSKECAREKTLLRIRQWHKDTAKRQEDERVRLRCAEILEAVPPGTMSEDEALERAKPNQNISLGGRRVRKGAGPKRRACNVARRLCHQLRGR